MRWSSYHAIPRDPEEKGRFLPLKNLHGLIPFLRTQLLTTWGLQPYCNLLLPIQSIHGNDIFTNMNGECLWISCRLIYHSHGSPMGMEICGTWWWIEKNPPSLGCGGSCHGIPSFRNRPKNSSFNQRLPIGCFQK